MGRPEENRRAGLRQPASRTAEYYCQAHEVRCAVYRQRWVHLLLFGAAQGSAQLWPGHSMLREFYCPRSRHG